MTALSPAGLTAEQVLDVVRAAIVTVLEVDAATVSRGTRLVDDLHADSLALVEIVEIVEETLIPLASGPFHIEDADLDDIATVGEAVDYCLARL